MTPPGFRKLFGTLATVDGRYEVIALDTGRPVACRDTRSSAAGHAYRLNVCASQGGRELSRALGAGRSNPRDDYGNRDPDSGLRLGSHDDDLTADLR